MIVRAMGGLWVELELGRYKLSLEPDRGPGLFTGSPPFYRSPSPPGSSGPFSWRPVELEGLRGRVTGYEISAGGLKLLYAGGALRPFSAEADVLVAPAGGLWYMDAKAFCETVRRSSVKAAVPVAVWYPGSKRSFEGLEEVRRECRGFRRIRAEGEWSVNFDPVKATIALIDPVPSVHSRHKFIRNDRQ
ncbi:MAG: hypothetical protein GXO07_01940 [Crenarchaeota archaeon]|nr:hypothetical protein [Thermoproteota archaeon]